MYLDIYVLTDQWNESTLHPFIDQYVDQGRLRAEIAEYDLLVLPEGRRSFDEAEAEEPLHFSVSSKEALIALGIAKIPIVSGCIYHH